MRESARVGLVAAMAVAMMAPLGERSALAAPDLRQECAASAEQAQLLRDEGKYRRAREQMLACAQDACPAPIKSDCSKWLVDLNRDAPTVVFGARDATGADLFDVRVSMDDDVIQERLDGKPVLVDSGEHTFTFELSDGSVREERVLLRAAEKARPIIASFSAPGAGTASPPDVSGPPSDRGSERASAVPALVVGGVGVAALGSFAIFGMGGKAELDDLQKCKPTCAEDAVDSARTKLLIADISLGVGVVALGVATYMYFTRPTIDSRTPTAGSLRFGAGPVAGGAMAGVGGSF